VVREGAEQVVEEVLGLDELTAPAGQQGFQQDPGGQSGLSDAGGPDEDKIGGLTEEVQGRELLHDGTLDAGLAVPGEGLQGPALGEFCALDAELQKADLLGVVFLAQQAAQELGVGGARSGGGGQALVQDLADPAELEACEELVEFVIHRFPPGRWGA
jgi:hypothetical protein